MEVQLDSAEFRVLESAGHVSVCCERSGATGKSVTVNITSSPGTATGECVPEAFSSESGFYFCVLFDPLLQLVRTIQQPQHPLSLSSLPPLTSIRLSASNLT